MAVIIPVTMTTIPSTQNSPVHEVKSTCQRDGDKLERDPRTIVGTQPTRSTGLPPQEAAWVARVSSNGHPAGRATPKRWPWRVTDPALSGLPHEIQVRFLLCHSQRWVQAAWIPRGRGSLLQHPTLHDAASASCPVPAYAAGALRRGNPRTSALPAAPDGREPIEPYLGLEAEDGDNYGHYSSDYHGDQDSPGAIHAAHKGLKGGGSRFKSHSIISHFTLRMQLGAKNRGSLPSSAIPWARRSAGDPTRHPWAL